MERVCSRFGILSSIMGNWDSRSRKIGMLLVLVVSRVRPQRRVLFKKAGIIYADIWDGFVDQDGDYARCRCRISRVKPGGCVPPTACIPLRELVSFRKGARDAGLLEGQDIILDVDTG